ncbi:carbohydrate-binding domain-containing protein [Saccharibacillus sp. CPCC 101409]|uniref:carbohydrate-binding domain-containing protein n=1 Tax=Saccharibacillus sp. CPCC 101409 TaxID=3058041 RepID=UPI002670E4C5|nr:carbohydrate-binding domain-containing protein [Saccharibacillus sp. CPCC 101409]MDO3409848.1 carbohydrate-binding domain-containing protein [Saccharibacillus sp. CPCC 101409]
MKKTTKIEKAKKFQTAKAKRTAAFLGAVLLLTGGAASVSAQGLSWSSYNGYLLASTSADATTSSSGAASSASDLKVANLKVSDLVTLKTKDYGVSWNKSTYTTIALNNTKATVSGSGAKATGSTVTISKAGTYVISGKLTDGQIIVAAADTDDVHIVLKGATVANDSTSPFYIKSADKVVVTLSAGTTNTFTDASDYTFAEGEDEPDAAIFSKTNLTINGTGALNVTGNYKDGIHSKDNLNIVNGKITVKAADDAIVGKDRVVIENGTFKITAGGDGIKSNNDSNTAKGFVAISNGTFDITAANDGIQAETSLVVDGGTFNIVTGGGYKNGPEHTEEGPGGMGGGDFGGQMPEGWTPPTNADGTAMTPPTNADGTTTPQVNAGGTPPTNSDGTTTPPTGTTNPAGNSNAAAGTTTTDSSATTEEETSESMKALKAGTELVVNKGTFTIDAADDAVHSNGNVNIVGGTFNIATGDDAFHADAVLEISSGKIVVTDSYESLEGFVINIKGGDIDVTASDDGVNAAGDDPTAAAADTTTTAPAAPAAGASTSASTSTSTGSASASGAASTDATSSASQMPGGGMGGGGMMAASNAMLNITGGTLTVDAAGDGLDSNGSIKMSGGTVIVNGPTDNGNGPLDYDGTFTITGGTLVASGSSGMAQAPSTASSQRSLGITFATSLAAGTLVHVEDSSGNNVLTFAPAKSFSSVVVSSSALKAGETYTVSTGGKSTGTNFDGLYTGGTYSGGTAYTTFEFSDSEATTWVNASGVTTAPSGMGGMGGGMGGDGTDRGPRGTNASGTTSSTSASGTSTSTSTTTTTK